LPSPLELALAATGVPVTLVDPTLPEQPLIWVNEAFLETTGYRLDEVVGRNCRFLQGPDTDPLAVAVLHAGIAERRPTTVTLVNYRKDGARFWNRVRIDPVFDEEGSLVAFIGVQADVSDEIQAAQDRDLALQANASAQSAATEARFQATEVQRQVAHVSTVTAELATTLDLDDLLDGLSAAIVPEMADWAVIVLREQGGTAGQVTVRTSERDTALGRDLAAGLAADLTPRSGLAQILAGRAAFMLQDGSWWDENVDTQSTGELIAKLGASSTMYVPLLAGRTVIGAIALVASSPGRHFDATDLDLAAELGRRAGLIVDNARLYAREHLVAASLQHSLLPTLPATKGLDIGARYMTADRYVDVGGDFYEVLPLPDGSVAVAVGDVVGHDMSAAAAMGQLRSLLRTVAWTSAEDERFDPSEVLARVDRLVQHLDVGPYATLFYGRLVPASTSNPSWQLHFATAGHPPPLIRMPDGSVVELNQASGLLLGASDDPVRNTAVVDLPPGAVLLVFSDGLVERRGEDLETGYERVVERLGRSHETIDELLDAVVGVAGRDRIDDIALLAVRLAPGDDSESWADDIDS
jgi:PAS domain S-box-containing protein